MPAPLTADVGATIAEAAGVMLDHGVGGLPVVYRGLLVGIVTRADLVDRLAPHTPARWWMVFIDCERLARECQKARGATVGEVMTRPVVSVAPEETLEVAAQLLRDHHIVRLPVADHGRLLGIVSHADLLQALAGTERAAIVAPEGGAAPREPRRAPQPATGSPGRKRPWSSSDISTQAGTGR